MDLKPFMSSVSSWRRHFKDTVSKGYDGNKRFHVIQEGSGFPVNNIISVSPAKQTEEIAKSEIIEMNRTAFRKQYNKNDKLKTKSRKMPKVVKVKTNTITKKKKLSHKKRKGIK